MNILYVSSLCSNNKFKDLFETAAVKPAQQAQKYHKLMVEGLAKNNKVSVHALSALPINREMSSQKYYKSAIEKSESIIYEYLPFFNWSILRQIFLFIACFLRSLGWCLKQKERVIICDTLNIALSFAVILVSKITRTNNIGIVTDVPTILAGMNKKKVSFKIRLIAFINMFIINKFNSFCFLTEFMNDLINKERKPYVVIEGQVDNKMADNNNDFNNKNTKTVCLYAGALKEIYGLRLLTEAFILAGVENSELHIYGSGDFEAELRRMRKKFENIKYFGVLPNDVIVKEQLKATLLINPRPTNEEYTKYSFPSKNMEYIVSGTPILTTDLPGMPTEYKDYVFIIENETVEGLATKIREILLMNKKDLHLYGLRAKEFALREKNNVIQAKKIIALIDRLNLQPNK